MSITDKTKMDHTVIPSSILQHRMYALLSDEGYIVKDPGSIVNFHDFKQMLENDNLKNIVNEDKKIKNDLNLNIEKTIGDGFFVGIDTENISNFKNLKNYDNQFYKANFSSNEINYCKSRIDPKISFAGLFSLKEAILKADNSYKNIPFNQIEIIHDQNGKPSFLDFSLSISHTDTSVTTIAIKQNIKKKSHNESIQNSKIFTKKEVICIMLITFTLSLFASLLLCQK